MDEQTLSKLDFKKYLLSKLPDSRQDELIFWKRGIPLPIDLIYRIFDDRGKLLKIYLDHIASASLYSYSIRKDSTTSFLEFTLLPNIQSRNHVEVIKYQYQTFYIESNISSLITGLADNMCLLNYSFSVEDYLNSLSHEGRKYSRLYLPSAIRKKVNDFKIDLQDYVGLSNNDMFGNIVADELGVYRSGFSDAFAAIFNKLLDFILENTLTLRNFITVASDVVVSQVQEPKTEYITYSTGKVSDGGLWMPQYVDAKSTFLLNSKHPYFELVRNKSGLEVLVDIVNQFAVIEGEAVKETTVKVLETFRQEVSRKLRMIAEDLDN
jgi:hypothetical protein